MDFSEHLRFNYDPGGHWPIGINKYFTFSQENLKDLMGQQGHIFCFSKPGKRTNQFAFWNPQRIKTAS